MPFDITSPTAVVLGSLPSATARTVMSRSVIVPTRRSFAPTGNRPKSPSRIEIAASLSFALGSVSCTLVVITSLSCIASLHFACLVPRRDRSGAVAEFGHTLRPGAVVAAVDRAPALEAVASHAHVASCATRRQGVNCALEAVEGVRRAAHHHLEGLV